MHALDDLSVRLPVGAIPMKDSGVGPGQEGAIRRLRQAEDVAPLEAVALLTPGRALIVGNENAAILLSFSTPAKMV